MKSLINKILYGSSSKLRDYEVSCLTYFLSKLPEQVRLIMEAQLKAIDLIQRSSQDKLVVFFLSDYNHANIGLFPNTSSELHVANIQMKINSSGLRFKCQIVFHEGRISSLEFTKPPKDFVKERIICEKVEVFADVLQSQNVMQDRLLPPKSVYSKSD